MVYYGYGPMMGYGFGILGFVIWLAVIAAVVWFIIWVVKKSNHGEMNQMHNNNAMDILKTRYAEGEITKKQFEDMKKDLKN